MGELLARRGIGLVYGGGSIGLMGVIAGAAKRAGGEVIGVIPEWLAERERPNHHKVDLRIVRSMHERKAMMAEFADAFVALPGGIGTMEEIFEVWTWAQLGQHAKPCGFLNVEGYFDGLFGFIEHMIAEGFLLRHYRDMLLVERVPEALISAVQAFPRSAVAPRRTVEEL